MFSHSTSDSDSLSDASASTTVSLTDEATAVTVSKTTTHGLSLMFLGIYRVIDN